MKMVYRSLKRGLIFLTAISIVLITIVAIIFYSEGESLEETIQTTVKTDLKAYSVDIDNKIAFIASDVLLLEDIILNRELLKYNAGSTEFKDPESKQILEMDVVDWIKNRNTYDQVRILDMSGQEIFRANYNNGSPIIVDDSLLQDKSGRYYFENAVNLDDDVIYMSKIDLNVENGVIEEVNGEPKEMLRIGSPIFDADGNQLGIILVNYFAGLLFHDEETSSSVYAPFEIINNNGYYLHADNIDIEYGFMYPDKQNEVFSKYHDYDIVLETDEDISQNIYEGEIYTSLIIDNVKLSDAITNTIGRDIDVYSDNGDIYIFGEVEFTDTIQYKELLRSFLFTVGIVILFSLLISRLVDEIIYSRNEHLKVLEFTSSHDLLTGLPNRANIFKRIEYMNSRKEKYALLFLDFDKFKAVNDDYGHQIGDKVLIEGSKRLQACVRETDVTARLGGDEFLILINDITDIKTLDRISNKIRESISKEFSFDKVTCNIGVSIGISIQDGTKSTEDMVHSADKEMYKDKNK